MNLVKITDKKELVVSLEDISKFSGVKYKSLTDYISRNKEAFTSLGLNLEIKGNLRGDFKSLLLNEPQATLLMMFMKNTTQVKDFKIKLVQEFFKMREFIRKGTIISDEFKEHIEKFLPKGGYLEENPKGEIKTQPVRGYYRVDKNSQYGKLLTKKYQLQKRLNSLLREEYEIEIKMVEQELKEIEEDIGGKNYSLSDDLLK